MKKFILLLSILSFGFGLSAQSFELVNTPDTVYYNPAIFHDIKGYVKNVGNFGADVSLSRVQNDTASGHETNFCWGIFCYDAVEDNSQVPATIGSGATDTTFKLTLTPNGFGGTTVVTMRFVNDENANDTLRRTFVFMEDPTASRENELENLGYTMELAGANPVGNSVSLNVNIPTGATAKAIISDLNGRTLTSKSVSQNGVISLPMDQLSAGIYMARLEANGSALRAIRIVKQ